MRRPCKGCRVICSELVAETRRPCKGFRIICSELLIVRVTKRSRAEPVVEW